MTKQNLAQKVGALPPELQQEVEDFVEFVTQKYHNSFVPRRSVKNEKLNEFLRMEEEFDKPVVALKRYY